MTKPRRPIFRGGDGRRSNEKLFAKQMREGAAVNALASESSSRSQRAPFCVVKNEGREKKMEEVLRPENSYCCISTRSDLPDDENLSAPHNL